MARHFVANLLRFGSRTWYPSLRAVHTCSEPAAGFKPGKVAVVTKTTRYEFEQQRYRYAGLSEQDLKQLVRFWFCSDLMCRFCLIIIMMTCVVSWP